MATLDAAPDPLAPNKPVGIPTPTPRPPMPGDSAPDQGDTSQQTEEVTVTGQKATPKHLTSEDATAAVRDMQEKVGVYDAEKGAMTPPPYKPPAPPTPKSTNPMEVWGSTAMLLAGIGSLLTRAPLTTALNSAAGVMNAFKAGDKEEADLQYRQWQQSYNEYNKLYEYQTQAYKDARQAKHNDVMETIAATNAVATAVKDDAMVAATREAAQNRHMDAVSRLNNDRARLHAYMDINADKIAKAKAYREQSEQLRASPEYQKATPQEKQQMEMQIMPGSLVPQQAIDLLATTYIKTGKFPYGLNKETKDRALAAVGRQMAAQNLNPNEIVADQQSFAANKQALGALTKQTAAISGYEKNVEKEMKLAEKLMPANAPVDIGPWLNKWVETGKVQAGDKNAPAYLATMMSLANEYAKVISGSTGAAGSTEGARQEAAEMINKYLNQGQIKGLFSVMRTSMRNRTSSNYEAMRGLRSEMANTVYSSPDEVKEAVESGALDADTGAGILETQFGMEE
jgi:hypothetical protein